MLAAALIHATQSVAALLALPPLLWWLHRHYGVSPRWGDQALTVWVALMWALAGLLTFALRRLRANPPQAEHADRRWRIRLMSLAAVVGLAWAAPIPLTLHEPLPQFHLLLYASLCAVTSSGAMYLSLVPALFLSFSGTALAVLMVCSYWVFPQEWPFMVAALLLFAAVTLRHALQSRRTMEKQLALEEGYRQMSAQATQALLEKNHFLNAASHDLRQPVHAMGLTVEATLQQHGHDTRLAPQLEHLRQCAQSIQFMLESLLDLARIESGRFAPQPQTLGIQALLADVPPLFEAQARGKGLDLRLRTPRRQALHVHADPALLRQALFNLVQNAIRYTRRGGVLITARERGRALLLQVWDTGVGIPEAEQARIFAPFERGPATAPGLGASHGLGLAVVVRSAALMGAACGVRSVPSRGSCFWLQLPLIEPAAAPASVPAPAEARLPPLPGRCLVVEDDADVTHAWRLLFDAWGTSARFADGAASAHRLLDEGFEPQALVGDLRLGGGENGWELLEALAARCPEAGCLLVSADLTAPEFSAADDHGCLVLRKPVAPAALHRALRPWLKP